MAKLTTPFRVVVLLTAIVVLMVLLLANAVGATGATGTDDSGAAVEYGTHLVIAGDTLWDIATEHTAPGEDVRRVVFDIQRLNGLNGSVILPGQVLQVPIPG